MGRESKHIRLSKAGTRFQISTRELGGFARHQHSADNFHQISRKAVEDVMASFQYFLADSIVRERVGKSRGIPIQSHLPVNQGRGIV